MNGAGRPSSACRGVAIGPDVLVVAVLYNSAERVPELLEVLLAWDRTSRVLLVDNDSRDTSQVAQTLNVLADSRVDLLAMRTNLGFGAGANLALGHRSDHENYLLVLNPDIRVTVNGLDRLISVLDGDDRVAAVGPTTRWRQSVGLGRTSTRPLNSLLDFVPVRLTSLLKLDGRWRTLEGSDHVAWLEGSIVLLRETAFSSVGGFDDSFFLYSEDEDLCRRLWAAGWAIVQVDCGQEMYHERGGSGASSYWFSRAHFHAGVFNFLLKWYSLPAAIPYATLFTIYHGARRALGAERVPSISLTLRLMRDKILERRRLYCEHWD
jgi:N-acetylglucosaminyl-diphospho-decaprenol L-rhamnosyltransferase